MDWGASPAARALRQARAVAACARRTGCGADEAAGILAEAAGAGGAYSYLKTGQYTAFNGIQGQRHGNLHFAGEHTSPNYQGYVEGALRSGYRCAAEITGG